MNIVDGEPGFIVTTLWTLIEWFNEKILGKKVPVNVEKVEEYKEIMESKGFHFRRV